MPDPAEFNHAVTLFDQAEPRSLVNIVWTGFRPVIERVVKARPELFELSERRLTRLAEPEILHRMLRLRFWSEYDMAQNSQRLMMQSDIIRGLCTHDYWFRHICPNPEIVAFIITPPPRYISKMEAMLDLSLNEMEEILSLPIKDAKGKPDIGIIKEKVKIFQYLEQKVKGAIVQRLAIHQKIDQTTQIGGSIDKMSLNDLESLDSMIGKVKRQIERTQNREMILLESPKSKEGVEVGSENVGSEVESGSNETSEIEEDKIP